MRKVVTGILLDGGSEPAGLTPVVTEGKTKTEIMRCLKHYIAREVFPHLLAAVPNNPQAGHARQATAAA